MKIGLVNNVYQRGGAETLVRQLHFGYQKDHESFLYIAWGQDYPDGVGVGPMCSLTGEHTEQTARDDSLLDLEFRRRQRDLAFRRFADSGLDLVHVHNFHGDYASVESLAYLAKRKPLVWSLHRFWGITGGCDHPVECSRYLQKCGLCPRVNEPPICGVDNTGEQHQLKLDQLRNAPIHVVATSRHAERRIKESPIGSSWEITYIPNGVNTTQFSYSRKRSPDFRKSLGLRPEAVVILIVNRDFRHVTKGFSTIKEALASSVFKRSQFVLAGSNSDWAINELPSNFNCVDKGYVSSREQMAALYEAADVFLYASPGENFPCAILEAMSSKCCVVSTPTDGVLEQIEDGVTGIVAASFAPSELATSLASAVSNPGRAKELGNSARDSVKRSFTEQMMIDAHLKMYAELINRTPERATDV
jgi:glycosyltransferase involved in cell wall biosynthesis